MADKLTVSTVLVQDREHLRSALIERIEVSAGGLHKTASTSARLRWRRGGPQKSEERAMRLRIEDLGKCADLMGQIGWRD